MLVAVEGIDGSGKTTTAAELVAVLGSQHGVESRLIDKREPIVKSVYVNEHLRALAAVIWNPDPDAPIEMLGGNHWGYLHAAYLSALAESVRRGQFGSSGAGTFVVDGWLGKLVARMSTNAGETTDTVEEFFSRVPRPDLTVLIDVDPEIVAARRAGKVSTRGERGALGQGDNGDFIAYQSLVRARLLERAATESWFVHRPQEDDSPADVAAVLARAVVQVG
ncbi:dTMP kinase [Rhodococcus erythropolis]|uniref:dTMP kinase n=1 Tax=Rhodococcus erythropolis TaxID=1833 RepID=UPI001BE819C6|nr:hypothetical protein [Rhodococcus erythropolis]MBT2269022.1 hypothetical protein [Rhodococcus erythropolis]